MDAQLNWFFDWEVKSCIYVPVYIIVGFQGIDWLDDVVENNDVSCRPHVISAQCFIETEKFPQAGCQS